MKFTLKIECINEAFDPDPRPEVHRILGEVADKVAKRQRSGWIHDRNGNRVGHWEFPI